MLRFKVADMTCGHCASVIDRAVKSVDPQAEISADIRNGEVTVRSSADEAQISDVIRLAGYENQKLAA